MKFLLVNLFDVIEMKKPHPCTTHSKLFQVVRLGADLKIQCLGCGNVILMDRDTFNRRVKAFVRHEEKPVFQKD